MDSIAFALTSARIGKLKAEIQSLNSELEVLKNKTNQIQDRKTHLKKQLDNTLLQTTYIKKLLQ